MARFQSCMYTHRTIRFSYTCVSTCVCVYIAEITARVRVNRFDISANLFSTEISRYILLQSFFGFMMLRWFDLINIFVGSFVAANWTVRNPAALHKHLFCRRNHWLASKEQIDSLMMMMIMKSNGIGNIVVYSLFSCAVNTFDGFFFFFFLGQQQRNQKIFLRGVNFVFVKVTKAK